MVVNVLFDTGALGANYISDNKYYEMREKNLLSDNDIIRQRTCVGLADNSTRMFSDIMIEFPILLSDTAGGWHTYDGIFVVLDLACQPYWECCGNSSCPT